MMAQAVCDACGKDSHVYMAIATDGEVNAQFGERNYCLYCAMFMAGVLEAVHRTFFRRGAIHE